MISTCTRCHQLYDFPSEEAAYEPGRLCPTCYHFGECVRLAATHVADGGDDATYMALMSRTKLWLRARGIMAGDSVVREEADKFLLAVYAL